jgi:hypothetical protein
MQLPVVAALFALSTACYRYDSVAGPAPAAGSHVAVRLTDQGTVALANELGPQVRWVEGDLVSADSAAVELQVSHTEDDRRVTTDWRGERVALPRLHVAELRLRRISAPATGLLGGLIAGSMVAAYELIGGSGALSGPNGGTGPGTGTH